MKVEQVAKLSPEEILLYWIKERNSIRLLRKSNKPKPWTDDEILSSYRFCNVRRMDDRVSSWLLNNWYKPNYNHPNTLLAAVIARHFNRIETLDALGFPLSNDLRTARDRVKKYRESGLGVFNGAYMIRACPEYADKVDMVFEETAKQFLDNPAILNTDSMEECVETVGSYRNFGTFMAGQVVADLRWGMSGAWKDRKTWAPMGPGSKRGLNRLRGVPIKTPMKPGDFLEGLRGVIDLCRKKLPSETTRNLEAIDYQNCLCETDKYMRALSGEGRPKQKYEGA